MFRRKDQLGQSVTPIHSLGAHDIDLMRWYFDSEPLRSVPMAQRAC